jgi:HEAT repeat protein
MKSSHLKGLTLTVQTLIGKLMSWSTLSQRWSGSDDTALLLEQVGSAAEPLAIPSLISFALADNAEVRAKAKSSIRHLLAQIRAESLPFLDESLRRSWGQVEDWYGLKPGAVKELGGDTDEDVVFLGLVSCHRNGYVRAEALRILGSKPSGLIIPFVLMRLVDWVSEVRFVAEDEFQKKLVDEHADSFVNCLPLTDRLAKNSRYRSVYSLWIEALLISPQNADALRRGTHSTDRLIRRHCFKIAVENRSTQTKELILEALQDTDVIVRARAFSVAPMFLSGNECDWVREASTDPYGPIRRMAFENLVAKPAHSLEDLAPFLLDRSVVIRRAAQSAYLKLLKQSSVGVYRVSIRDPVARNAEVAVIGLAETGDRSDLPAILEMLPSRSARVRGAAVRALRILGIDGQEGVLLKVVASDVRSVARKAASALLARRDHSASAVWVEALKNPDKSLHCNVLKLIRSAPKWQQLNLYLGAVVSSDESLSACAIEMLMWWLNQFNASFVNPSLSERDLAASQLDRASELLPARLVSELRFTLRMATR